MLSSVVDPDARIRWVAAQSIATLGPEAINALIPLTTNADVNIRHAAVYALGEGGTNAMAATMRLIECTMDPNAGVRGSAYYSLGRIGPAALPMAVANAVTNSAPAMRDAAFRSILVLAPAGQINLGKLMTATNTAEIRHTAIISLIRGRQTNEYARILINNALQDEDSKVRETAKLAQHWITTGSLRRPK